MGLQASALYAAAQGAVCAYHHVTGNEWKAYDNSQPAGVVERRAIDARRLG